jgi:hypothetical protein
MDPFVLLGPKGLPIAIISSRMAFESWRCFFVRTVQSKLLACYIYYVAEVQRSDKYERSIQEDPEKLFVLLIHIFKLPLSTGH